MIRWSATAVALAALILAAGPASADFQAGLAAARQGDFETALREWLPLAEAGDRDSQFNLALMYGAGAGVEQDDAQALHWFVAAAELEHTLAQYRAGIAYQLGQSPAKDLTEGPSVGSPSPPARAGHALPTNWGTPTTRATVWRSTWTRR